MTLPQYCTWHSTLRQLIICSHALKTTYVFGTSKLINNWMYCRLLTNLCQTLKSQIEWNHSSWQLCLLIQFQCTSLLSIASTLMIQSTQCPHRTWNRSKFTWRKTLTWNKTTSQRLNRLLKQNKSLALRFILPLRKIDLWDSTWATLQWMMKAQQMT